MNTDIAVFPYYSDTATRNSDARKKADPQTAQGNNV